VTARRPGLALPRTGGGFTLIELAVGLFIVTLVLGALLVPLSQQVESRKFSETQRTLDLAVEALQGFAAINGRLPCPASATSNGLESDGGVLGRCTNPLDGFLPAATLGLNQNVNGYLVDSWSTDSGTLLAPNRIRYAISTAVNPCADPSPLNYVFATPNGMKNCWAQITGTTPPPPPFPNYLTVCNTSNTTGPITATGCPPPAGVPPLPTTLTTNAIAIVYSVGANAAATLNDLANGFDEQANPNPLNGSVDRTFVWHVPSGRNAPNGEFDDVMVWISPNILYSKLIAAGQLP